LRLRTLSVETTALLQVPRIVIQTFIGINTVTIVGPSAFDTFLRLFAPAVQTTFYCPFIAVRAVLTGACIGPYPGHALLLLFSLILCTARDYPCIAILAVFASADIDPNSFHALLPLSSGVVGAARDGTHIIILTVFAPADIDPYARFTFLVLCSLITGSTTDIPHRSILADGSFGDEFVHVFMSRFLEIAGILRTGRHQKKKYDGRYLFHRRLP